MKQNSDQQPKQSSKIRSGKTQSDKNSDHQSAVANKYSEYGWIITNSPGGMNDMIAHKQDKLHFIRIVTPENYDEARYHGLAKNSFIQNAFSNGAIPVHAHVVAKGGRTKVTFENVNIGDRIIIGRAEKPKVEKVKPEKPKLEKNKVEKSKTDTKDIEPEQKKSRGQRKASS
jgi:hypothetical protein